MNHTKITYLQNKIKELEQELKQWKNIMYDHRKSSKEIKDAKHEVYCIYLTLDFSKTELIKCLKEQINNSNNQ